VAQNPDAVQHTLVNGDTFHAQFVSAPLAAQTFTVGDAFKMALQASEVDVNNNLTVRIFIGLVSNDGATALATLRTKLSIGGEVLTTIRNNFQSRNLSGGYTAAGGERLVVELSLNGLPSAPGATHNGSMRFGGDGSSGDLPENSTETGLTFNPWIEFANTILFSDGSSPISGTIDMVFGSNAPLSDLPIRGDADLDIHTETPLVFARSGDSKALARNINNDILIRENPDE